jgi:hypothetical protein
MMYFKHGSLRPYTYYEFNSGMCNNFTYCNLLFLVQTGLVTMLCGVPD